MPNCLSLIFVSAALSLAPGPDDYFKITVIDQESGRGVPLVELQTVNNIRVYTDSAGVVAFHEPGLMDRQVFFRVSSHGYEFAQDGFGYPGVRLQVTPGGTAVLKLRRINIAQRLYRMTGAGIYRDSVLVGDTAPTERPLLNGMVLGSDSVVNAVYRGKIYWFWGDTNKPSYPLGNFHVPGATSILPAAGGLDPEVGVNLEYFVDADGFAKPTASLPGKGPTWIDGVVVITEADGTEHLLAKYVKIKPPLTVYERGLVEFDDRRQQFGKRMPIPLDAPLQPTGHPLHHDDDGVRYIYFGHPFPHVRVRATLHDLRDLSQYEAFTCLKQGSRGAKAELDRDDEGRLRFVWRRDTPPVVGKLRTQLIQQKKLGKDEGLIQLQDVATGQPVAAHGGSVYWNAYRQRWVAIILESYGTSLLGEIWYAESSSPLGPWVYARKVVTHDKYSFYNPKQHPMFDKDGGRTIFFEGTYTHTFSGNPAQTPRYDYNQIMYKLDLTDPRLALPVPVYQRDVVHAEPGSTAAAGEQFSLAERRGAIGWFALDRPADGAVPVFAKPNAHGGMVLRVGAPSDASPDRTEYDSNDRKTDGDTGQRRDANRPLFYGLPADLADPPETTVPLYEFVNVAGTLRRYSTQNVPAKTDVQGTPKVVCRVWSSPIDASFPLVHGLDR